MDPDYWKDTGLEGDRSAAMYFLRDEDFRQLLRDNGLPEEDYFRPDAPQAVAWDMLDIWRSTEGSKYNKLYHYHLLNGSSLPITQVAEQCGFGTIRSFNRVFLKEKGMTPSAFRKQNVL